jgi:hypothetical protein
MFVVDDERPEVVGVEENCALVVPLAVADVDVVVVTVGANVIAAIVVAVVAPIGVVDVDVVVVVAAAVVDAFVVPVVELEAAQSATGRLEQAHREGLVEQFCRFR